MNIQRAGSKPSSKGPADWFTGDVRIDPLSRRNAMGRPSTGWNMSPTPNMRDADSREGKRTCRTASLSVAIEEVPSSDWKDEVYQPDIVEGAGKLYKRPGYTM